MFEVEVRFFFPRTRRVVSDERRGDVAREFSEGVRIARFERTYVRTYGALRRNETRLRLVRACGCVKGSTRDVDHHQAPTYSEVHDGSLRVKVCWQQLATAAAFSSAHL